MSITATPRATVLTAAPFYAAGEVARIISGAQATTMTDVMRVENTTFLTELAKAIVNGENRTMVLLYTLEALAHKEFDTDAAAAAEWRSSASFYGGFRYDYDYVKTNNERLVRVAQEFLDGKDMPGEFKNRVMIALFN
jgi:hypothetical protein